MKEFSVGIDLHKTQFTVCVLCSSEVVEDGTKYPMTEEGFSSFAQRMHDISKEDDKSIIRIAIESTGNARYFKSVMENYNFNVTVVNTLKFKVVNMSTNKTDKHDARTLADFLDCQLLPQSHLCNAMNEGIRRILKSRSLLVADSIALKNQAHGLLLACGIQTLPAQFQSRKKRAEMIDQTEESTRPILKAIFDTIDVVENQIKVLESRLRTITADNEDISLLLTIPGIGIVNACTISAYTDNINRFEDYKHFSAYCGLVPWVQSSNNSTYYGRITKRGPQEMRTALVQCVVAMVRMDKTKDTNLITAYHELKDQKNSGKAIIATARKLTRIIYTMLTEKKEFNINLA